MSIRVNVGRRVYTQIGQRLQDFEIIEEIGRGSYGIIMRVKSKLNRGEYVLKQVNMSLQNEEEKREGLREVQILRKLRHPYIIKYYNSFMQDERLYIVLEYAQGGDLQRYIKEYIRRSEQIEEKEIWRYAFELCKSVEFLHKNSIVHCDIKSLNILLTDRGTLKLCDLGMSQYMNEVILVSQQQQSKLGTRMYQAPELIEQKIQNELDSKVDIWSIGCVIYQLVALKPPFEGDSVKELKQKILTENPLEYILNNINIQGYYSNQLIEFISKLLEKNPENRIKLNQIQQYFPFDLWNTFQISLKNQMNFTQKPSFDANNNNNISILDQIHIKNHLLNIKSSFNYNYNQSPCTTNHNKSIKTEPSDEFHYQLSYQSPLHNNTNTNTNDNYLYERKRIQSLATIQQQQQQQQQCVVLPPLLHSTSQHHHSTKIHSGNIHKQIIFNNIVKSPNILIQFKKPIKNIKMYINNKNNISILQKTNSVKKFTIKDLL